MAYIAKQFKQILFTAIFLHITAIALSQAKPQTPVSNQLRNFSKETADNCQDV